MATKYDIDYWIRQERRLTRVEVVLYIIAIFNAYTVGKQLGLL